MHGVVVFILTAPLPILHRVVSGMILTIEIVLSKATLLLLDRYRESFAKTKHMGLASRLSFRFLALPLSIN